MKYGRILILIILSSNVFAEVPPTLDEVSYGAHSRNTFDFWKAEGDTPRPVLIYIHGGSWMGFDKNRIHGRVPIEEWLAKGVSVASIDYRLTTKDSALLPAPVHDAARAVQFLRYHAKDYNIDPNRVALQGGSAGACSSMWILLHDDLADPDSDDPVLRESTRVSGAYARAGQTSIDPPVVDEWIGPLAATFPMFFNAVGEENYEDMMAHYDQHQALLREFSPINHLDANDPPLYMWYGTTQEPKTDQQAIHHGTFGVKLKEKSDEIGHECYLEVRWEIKPDGFGSGEEFLEQILLK